MTRPIAVDLYRDTMTKRTVALRRFMWDVPVGEEQKGEDPTIGSRTWWPISWARKRRPTGSSVPT